MRLLATLIIWIFVSAMAIVAMTANSAIQSGDMIPILAILLGAGAISTASVWAGSSSSESPRAGSRTESLAKRKRQQHERLSRMIEQMDDDDVYELEALLLARDDDQQQTNVR